MKKIKSFFRKKKASIELTVSTKKLSKDGEPITKWEEDYLTANKWKCPNCESGPLYEGPSGGMSTNIRCRICGQGYNVTPGMGIDNIGIDESWIDPQLLRSAKLNKIKKKS
jgi:transcription elongation factor Elf1